MAKLGQVRAPWACPQLHDMIVSAALDGARAMAAFQDGFLSSVRPGFIFHCLHRKPQAIMYDELARELALRCSD